MKILIYTACLFVFLLSACGSDRKEFEDAGGELSMCLENEPFTYISYEAEDFNSQEVLRQVVEGLVSFDPQTSKIVPQIAKDWTISEDGLTYTFELRQDVIFHSHSSLNSDDLQLSSKDVIATFEKICSKNKEGKETKAYGYIFKGSLKGADAFHSKKAKKISGLEATKHGVKITLLEKDDNFLFKLASVQAGILPKKLLDQNKLKDVVGSGPFMYLASENEDPTKINLVKNPNYYQVSTEGYALPFLDEIHFIVENKKLNQLSKFEQKEIDMILGLPTSSITKMLEGRIEDFNAKPPKLILSTNPVLVSNYYFFNMNDPRFQDVRVRQAFNYAINKDKIGTDILRNQFNELGIYGLIPPIAKDFRGYDFKGVKNAGYSFNPELAKSLMAQAGYPNGTGFGSVTLRFNIGDVNSAVAEEFANQINQVLGINVNIDGSSFSRLDQDASLGRGDIFRTAWSADYPNPETFLNQFYGKHLIGPNGKISSVNQAKYSNAAFDHLFEKAKREDDQKEKMMLYTQAEIELLKNPPFIPLWYNGDMQVVYSNVRNLEFNSLGLFNFKEVYKKEWTKEEYQKSIKN